MNITSISHEKYLSRPVQAVQCDQPGTSTVDGSIQSSALDFSLPDYDDEPPSTTVSAQMSYPLSSSAAAADLPKELQENIDV